MKVIATITKKEYADTYNLVWFDPCKHIDCSGVKCEECPLHKVADKLRDAQAEYMQVVDHLPQVDE